MPSLAIALTSVTKRFGTFVAVDALSLQVEVGEIFGLVGPNGSGKTTTVNMVSGLARPTSGQVQVLGHDIARDPRVVRASLGVVPQETALYEELSAEVNLRFHADLFDVPRDRVERRIAEVLDLVQLTDRRTSRVSTFSGGMKRRLALARALLHDPQLFYLDEPTLGVDVQSRRALWDHILELKQRGKTVLITTNYLEEANALCDRLAILDRGKLVALDTPAELKRTFGETVLELTVEPVGSAQFLDQLRQVPGVGEVRQEGATITVTVTGSREVTGQVISLVTVEHRLTGISQREPSIEEAFLRLTGRGLRD